MAKKSEILNEIHNRINESITGGSAVSKDFGLKKVINECLSVGAPEVIHILQQADSALSEGVEEKLLIRPLLEGLSRYESLFDVLKKNCDSMRLTIILLRISSVQSIRITVTTRIWTTVQNLSLCWSLSVPMTRMPVN